MSQNKLTPLNILRREKQILRSECAEGEARLGEHWSYVTDNFTSLLFTGALNGVRRKLGFGGSPKREDKENENSSNHGSNGLIQGVLAGLLAVSPLLWEMAQPMIMGFAMKKVKSIFTRKKKKKKRRDDDDD
ncbi:hypothetical protein [Dysgonomonas sp. ZJ709]|uniref:hypothetical protein n=1 Tax=Dysgonomonas sp. ZJ709 TaxID=2709797 RepID=UPI0013EA6284|nr:hypothetical protein [Dysgonomonas sp. ZJ709]